MQLKRYTCQHFLQIVKDPLGYKIEILLWPCRPDGLLYGLTNFF
jgi:hypothetical protein